MRTKLAIALTAAAVAAMPFAAAPARADENLLCEAFAPPLDRVACTVERVLCAALAPPFSICL